MKVQSEMLIYISLVNYAESGLRDIKKFLERLAAARKEAEELSGKVDKVYLTMGNRDLITIADLPNDATAATFAFRLEPKGNTRTTTMNAFREEALMEIIKAVKSALGLSYSAAMSDLGDGLRNSASNSRCRAFASEILLSFT